MTGPKARAERPMCDQPSTGTGRPSFHVRAELDARDELDADAYRAFVAIGVERFLREAARHVVDEALRAGGAVGRLAA